MSHNTGKINNKLTHDDLWCLINQHIKEKGFISHSIDSQNDFNSKGIEQIITKVYKIDATIKNERKKTEEDRNISKIYYRVFMDNIRLEKPKTTGDGGSCHEVTIYPIDAHVKDRKYNSELYVDVRIEASAFTLKGDEIKREPSIVKNLKITNIITMVKSNLCNTHGLSKHALLQLGEDPEDPGGYLPKAGNDWAIDNKESIGFNQPRIYHNKWNNQKYRLEIISKPGDSYQNGRYLRMYYLKNGAIMCELYTQHFKGIHFPFYLLFRAFGVTSDKEICDHILYTKIKSAIDPIDTEGKKYTSTQKKLMSIMEDAMFADYDTKQSNFGSQFAAHSQAEVLEHIVRQLPREKFKNLDMSNPEHVQQAVSTLLERFDQDILPHVGLTSASRLAKVRYLGYLINRMLYVSLGLLKPSDRDSYSTKRIHTAGISLAKIFKTHFGASIVTQIKKHFAKEFKNFAFKEMPLANILRASVNGADFERLIMQAVTAGTKSTIKINKYRNVINRLSSQRLDRKNYTKVFSTLRTIISPSNDSSKGSARAKQMRMPHPSSQGFIDLIHSAEGGDKVGLQKQMVLGTNITSYGSGELMKRIAREQKEYFRPIESVDQYEIPKYGKLFVNGEWLGLIEGTSAFVKHMVDLRRASRIDRLATIVWDNHMNEVNIWVDYGRFYRPIFIVYNNIRDYKKLGLKKPADPKDFRQGIIMSPQTLWRLKAGLSSLDELYRENIMEYITPGEQERLYIAATVDYLYKNEKNPIIQYTHCDIPESLMGIVGLIIPLANFNSTPRNTIATSQIKQRAAIYANNWFNRIDKDAFLQYQVQKPLVHTRVSEYLPPEGAMVWVAIMCYAGFNEEDSLEFCKAVSEKCKFKGCWVSYTKTKAEKSEKILAPTVETTLGMKAYANYNKLNDQGVVPIGTIIKDGDVIIGKVKILSRNIQTEKGYTYSDHSEVYKLIFPSVVHDVIKETDDEGSLFVKVAYRSLFPIMVGDKFSARSAQKGVCGLQLSQADMPFTENGLIPDIIMNPHSFPKRMTMGQPYETGISKLCAAKGVTCDATAFRNLDADALKKEMETAGLDCFGRERMYCGINGVYMDALIFGGPTYYQRLQKFISKIVYQIDIGPTDIITRQPLDGKVNQGGLKISELQRDVMLSHGCSRFFQEKFYEDSDDFDVYVCRCGSRAIVNKHIGIYRCINCVDNAEIYAIHSSWSSKQFFMELNAMNIGVKFSLAPAVFMEHVDGTDWEEQIV